MISHRLRSLFEPGALSCNFQPIVRASNPNDLYAVESLMRGPRGTPFEAPEVMFDYVRRKHAEAPVEHECIRIALCAVKDLPSWVAVTINVHTTTIARDDDFAASLVRTCGITGIEPSRIIIELVEYGSASTHPRFQRGIDKLRTVGVRMALDHFGARSSSSYQLLVDAIPSFLKIDPYLCHGVAHDGRRIAVMKSIVEMASELGADVIGAGVEARDDHHILRDLGVAYLQGPLFAGCLPRHPTSIVLAKSKGFANRGRGMNSTL